MGQRCVVRHCRHVGPGLVGIEGELAVRTVDGPVFDGVGVGCLGFFRTLDVVQSINFVECGNPRFLSQNPTIGLKLVNDRFPICSHIFGRRVDQMQKN